MPSIRQIRKELDTLLDPVVTSYHGVFAGSHVAELTRIDELASAIVAGTLSDVHAHALVAATRPEPAFWRTSLGQHLYVACDGRPEDADAVTAPVAHNVLKVVRQRIDQYVISGQLKRVPDLPVRVSAQSLLDLWTSRNPGGPS